MEPFEKINYLVENIAMKNFQAFQGKIHLKMSKNIIDIISKKNIIDISDSKSLGEN